MSDLLAQIERLPPGRSSEPIEWPGAGIPTDPAPSPMQIGRYEVSELLGRGAFGFVLRAFDPIFEGPRALKVPYPHVLAEPGRRQRFLKEPRILAQFDHPNVVRVHDADECGGVCYIAMELCEAGSLADWLNDLPDDAVIPADWAAELVKQVADGVQHVHERRIYHRDLKPANILLTPAEDDPTTGPTRDGAPRDLPRFRPKVGDFGLAKILDDGSRTSDGALIGTRPYMAPEQIRGDSASVGPATDVWALGVILYELLTRRLPFGTDEDPGLERKIRDSDPVPPRAFRSDLPRSLQRVCLRCLEKDPSDRYQSSRDLAYHLALVLEGRQPPGTLFWKRIVRWVKRHPARAALLGTATAAALVALGVVDYVRRAETDLLCRRLEIARVADLPDLVPRFPPGGGAEAGRLGRLFVTGTSDQRLAAALVLARRRSDKYGYGDYCYGRLLDAGAEEIAPIARLLNDRMPDLIPRLGAEVDREPPADGADKERSDRRRANAACALALLGPDERTWSLLRSRPDPQVRSFLIHGLGPAGVAPSLLVDRLEDPGTDASIRVALIQSLDSAPDPAWDAGQRARATRWLLDRYRNDPGAGVHGSAKWLLRRWGSGPDLDRIDRELAGASPPEPGSQWRISRDGLTLITVDDPALDRVIEVSDTEITVAMFRRFDPEFENVEAISPDESCPINHVTYDASAAFCNWLSGREGIREDEACYRRAGFDEKTHQPAYQPAPGHRDRAGFRLPTGQEFEVFCAAGTSTDRYCGDSDLLFGRYAWTWINTNGKAHPVAGRIPNDLGLFDTLGNLLEWCERAVWEGADGALIADLRGGWFGTLPTPMLGRRSAVEGVLGSSGDTAQGFRVVRTKKIR